MNKNGKWVVDWERNKSDFGRVEIEPDPEGVLTPEILAGMTAVDFEHEGCNTKVLFLEAA
jgi:hypothetical protein